MRKIIQLFLLLLVAASARSLQAQSDKEYLSIRRALLSGADRIVLRSAADVDLLMKNYRKLYGTVGIRVDGPVPLDAVAEAVFRLDELLELDLRQWQGEPNAETLAKLWQVEEIGIHISEQNEALLEKFPDLSKFRSVVLQFDAVPDDFSFFKSLSHLHRLWLIAPFSPADLQKVFRELQRFPKLDHLGISLNRFADLPYSARKLKSLRELTLIDNLSWLANKGWQELKTERYSINYTDTTGMGRKLNLVYLSDDVDLYPNDWEHLRKVFPNQVLADYQQDNDTLTPAGQSVLPFAARPRPTFAHHPGYQALFPEMEPRRNVYEIDPTQNNILYSVNGNCLMVPSNSLVLADGSLPQGKITVSLREMQRAEELLSHGAPTAFDSARTRFFLSQRYLADIRAVYNNQPLQVKPGNFLRLYARMNADSSDRFYALDEKNGRWNHFREYDYHFDDANLRVTDFYSWFKDSSARRHYATDQTPLGQRFLSGDHYYCLPNLVNEAWLYEENGMYVRYSETKPTAGDKTYNLRRGKSLIAVQKAFVDRNKEKGVVKFTLFDRSEGMLFPELKAFKGYTFAYTGKFNSKAFSQEYIFHRKFFDVRVEMEGTQAVVLLKCEDGFVRIPVDISYHPTGNTDKARKTFRKHYQRYRRLLVQKEQAFNTQMRGEYKEKIRESESRRTAPIGRAAYTENEFRIRSLGVFAWGHPEQQNDSMHLLVKFTDGGGLPVDVKTAFLLLKQPYTLYMLPKAETFEVQYRPDRFVCMGCLDYKGNVYVLNHERIGTLEVQTNSLLYLPANEVARPLRNRKEYFRILGIQERK